MSYKLQKTQTLRLLSKKKGRNKKERRIETFPKASRLGYKVRAHDNSIFWQDYFLMVQAD